MLLSPLFIGVSERFVIDLVLVVAGTDMLLPLAEGLLILLHH